MTISTDGYALLTTITLPGGVGGHGDYVAYDADTKTVWLAQSPDNNVVVIDTATNTIKAVIPNIGNANGVDFSSQYAFVADVTNNTTDVIDKRTFQVVARVAQTGTTPDSVTYISSTNQVFVASDDNNVEDAINATAPFTQTASLQLTPNPATSGPDVSTYVASKDLVYQPDDKQVDVINPHTGAIVATWPLVTTGSVKPGIYDPVTNTFVFGTTNHQLLVVNADTGAVLKTIAISGSVDQIAVDVAARLAFVGDKAGVIDVVSLDSGALVGGLPAEVNVHTLTVDPTTHQVYVYENNRNTVDVYALVPPAPSFTDAAAQALGQSLDTTLRNNVLGGTSQLRSVNSDGSIQTVPGGSTGVLLDNTGGHAVGLQTTYTGAFFLGSSADTVAGGGGQTIVSGTGGLTLALNGGVNSVVAGGNNAIYDIADTDTIALNNGNNTVLEFGATSTISGGSGHNLIGVTSTSGGVGGTTLFNSTGNDSVLTAAGSTTVDASQGGATSSQLVGVLAGNLTFLGGAGSSYVLGGNGHETVRGGSGALVARGNNGGGDLLVGGSGNNVLVGAGSGDLLAAGSGANILVAGAGNETLTGTYGGTTTSGLSAYYAGSGSTLINTGNGADTVYAGTGNATVNLGAATDVLTIANGSAGGTMLVNGFNAAAGERIHLTGFAANAAATAVAGETNGAGQGGYTNTTLSLSDGTKLVFANVSQVSTTAFA